MARKRRIIKMSVLPGEPVDGNGRVCIHLFVPDETGPFVETHALHPVFDECGQQVKQQVICKPTRGRLACDRKRTVAAVTRGNVTAVTMRTDSPNATTCPKCIASNEYRSMVERLASATNGS